MKTTFEWLMEESAAALSAGNRKKIAELQGRFIFQIRQIDAEIERLPNPDVDGEEWKKSC